MLLLLVQLQLNAEIIKTSDMNDVLKYVQQRNAIKTLVVFDIHNTLVRAKYMKNKLLYDGLKNIEKLTPEDKYIRFKWLYVVPTQPDVQAAFEQIQHVADTLILTKSKPEEKKYVLEQLRQVAIKPDNFKWVADYCIKYDNKTDDCNSIFTQGVIFSGVYSKGDILEIFLNNVNLTPTEIILVDDQVENHLSLTELARKLAIKFTGFWYTAPYAPDTSPQEAKYQQTPSLVPNPL